LRLLAPHLEESLGVRGRAPADHVSHAVRAALDLGPQAAHGAFAVTTQMVDRAPDLGAGGELVLERCSSRRRHGAREHDRHECDGHAGTEERSGGWHGWAGSSGSVLRSGIGGKGPNLEATGARRP
jgi:hypothetical protein